MAGLLTTAKNRQSQAKKPCSERQTTDNESRIETPSLRRPDYGPPRKFWMLKT
jgi:hypothetical protein